MENEQSLGYLPRTNLSVQLDRAGSITGERADEILDRLSGGLEPLSDILRDYGIESSTWYRRMRRLPDAMEAYRRAMTTRHLRAFDEIFKKLNELESVLDKADEDGRDGKWLWARQNAIKIGLDNLKWIASRHPWLSDKGEVVKGGRVSRDIGQIEDKGRDGGGDRTHELVGALEGALQEE